MRILSNNGAKLVTLNESSGLAPYSVFSLDTGEVEQYNTLPQELIDQALEQDDDGVIYLAEVVRLENNIPLIGEVFIYNDESPGQVGVYDGDSVPLSSLDAELDLIVISEDEAKELEGREDPHNNPTPITKVEEDYEEVLAETGELGPEDFSIVAAGYTSAERSQDAISQSRSSGGKFVSTGRSSRTEDHTNSPNSGGATGPTSAEQVIRAHLPDGLVLVENPMTFLAEALKDSEPVALIASADLIDDNRVEPVHAPKVIYLAVVSHSDPRDCFAVISVGRTSDGDFIVFSRVAGEWAESDEQKGFLQSPTPPSYVDLTNNEPVLLKALADLDETDASAQPPEPTQEVESAQEVEPTTASLRPYEFSDYIPVTGYKTNRDGNYTADERSRKTGHQDRGVGGIFVGDGKTRIVIKKGNSSTIRITLSGSHKVSKVKNPVSYIRDWLSSKNTDVISVRRTKDFISYFVPEDIEAKNDNVFYGGFADPNSPTKLYDILAFTKTEGGAQAWLRKDGMWRVSARYTTAFNKDDLGDNFVHLKDRKTVIEAVRQVDEHDAKKYQEKKQASLTASAEVEFFDEFGKIKGHTSGAMKLKNYWAFDPRGVAKWRPGTPGDLTRLHRRLSKYVGPHRAWGLAQNIHKLRFAGLSNHKRDKGA